MFGHGGSRIGAGRKRQLTIYQRVRIGTVCEYKSRLIAEQRAESRGASHPNAAKIQKLQEKMSGKRGRFADRRFPWDVATISRQLDKIGRRSTIGLRRPKGVRADILREVAAEVYRAERIRITARMVRRCWTEYRQFLRCRSWVGRN
jgi:hypothetical protein